MSELEAQVEDKNRVITQMTSQQSVFGGDSGLKLLERFNQLRPIAMKQTKIDGRPITEELQRSVAIEEKNKRQK